MRENQRGHREVTRFGRTPHSRSRRSWLVMAGIGAALALGGCSEDPTGPNGGLAVISVPFELTEDAAGRSGFRLIGVNGRVTVTGASVGETLRASGFRRVQNCSRSQAEAWIDDLLVEVTTTATDVVVQTVQPVNTGSCSLVVDYQLTVPERLHGQIVNVNGAIVVDDLDNGLSVIGVNGVVALTDVEDDITVRLTNGTITADLQPSGDHEIDLQTVNGEVALTIPTSTDAMLSIALVNGTITVSNLTVSDPSSSTTSFTGVLGTGEGLIVLRTVNGNVSVEGA